MGSRSVCCEGNTSWKFFRRPIVTREVPCCGCSRDPGRDLESRYTSVMTSRTFRRSSLLPDRGSRSRSDRSRTPPRPGRNWSIPTPFGIFSAIWRISSIAQVPGLQPYRFNDVRDHRGGKSPLTLCTTLVGGHLVRGPDPALHELRFICRQFLAEAPRQADHAGGTVGGIQQYVEDVDPVFVVQGSGKSLLKLSLCSDTCS